jgi:hypothetical protein
MVFLPSNSDDDNDEDRGGKNKNKMKERLVSANLIHIKD